MPNSHSHEVSRTNTKQDSLSIVLRTVEEHIADSSRERSIVLPLRLKRQWQKRKGHKRRFRRSRFVSMVTPHFEELPWFFQSDLALTRHFEKSPNMGNNYEVLMGSAGVIIFDTIYLGKLHLSPLGSLLSGQISFFYRFIYSVLIVKSGIKGTCKRNQSTFSLSLCWGVEWSLNIVVCWLVRQSQSSQLCKISQTFLYFPGLFSNKACLPVVINNQIFRGEIVWNMCKRSVCLSKKKKKTRQSAKRAAEKWFAVSFQSDTKYTV